MSPVVTERSKHRYRFSIELPNLSGWLIAVAANVIPTNDAGDYKELCKYYKKEINKIVVRHQLSDKVIRVALPDLLEAINFSSKDEELKLDFFYSFGENLVFIFDDQNSYNNFFDSRLNQILLTSHVFYVEYEIEGEKRIGFCDFNLTFYRIWNAYLKTYVKSCEKNLIQGKLNFQ